PMDTISELVLGILSQNTTDRNARLAFRALKAAFVHWGDVAQAPEPKIAEAIRPAGLHHAKARYVKIAVQRAVEQGGGNGQHHGSRLDFLASMSVEKALAYLETLPGVGPKTARIVLLFGMGIPVFPVDTHVHRVSRRLGIIGPKVSREQAHRVLEQFFPPDDYYFAHMLLIYHGRRTCAARKPRCWACALGEDCSHYRSLQESAK
ncbi:MAG: endonuclease III, partial [Dehalococcoidia bacterium]|nr:endonuclease III [Dehalococcoidia bacterium]